MKFAKKLIVCLVVVFSLVPALPAVAATDPFGEACKATGTSKSAACQENGSDPIAGSNGILAKATRLIAYLAGAASIILIVISGFMYVTAGGDTGKLNTAKQTIIYAVVGLVIVVIAQSIIVFVLNQV